MGSNQEIMGMMENKEGFIGVLEVFIHQARDIHNICIYHKQDVYAKIFLTSDPELTESTRTINGGGQNPVFNQNLRINVRNGDGSLRCEIWMLSRVRNYLQDQLLGFALVPLCEILVNNRNLEKEFELSTSDLFHSPSGFVKLSVTYNGKSPDLLEIPTVSRSLCDQDLEESDQVSCELGKIEFPDPNIMNENEIMVSEYYSKCVEIESKSIENDDSLSSDSNIHLVSRFPKDLESPPRFPKDLETPPRFPKENLETPPRNDPKPSEDKKDNNTQSVVEPFVQPCIGLKDEVEQKMVQQDIVDMYMKSMKQFTEALAKMNLPIDKGNNDSKESKGEGPSPKVFYGSRAFF